MVTLAELKTLKVNELREALKNEGLDSTGLKAELIARLEAHLTEKEAAAAPNGSEAMVVTVETEGQVDEAVAEKVADVGAEVAAEAVAPKEGVPGLGEETEQIEETTTITADADGKIIVEKTEEVVPAEEATQTVTEVPATDAQEAVKEAVEVAQVASEVENAPVTAVTTVEETEAKDDVITETSIAVQNTAPDQDVSTGIKLFVGCVPLNFTDDELKPHFAEVGNLKDIAILRDATSGKSKGCAFVMYEDKESAENAIEKLNKQKTLPGAPQPLEVRFARETNKVQPVSAPNEKNQLFFARAPLTATSATIKEAFEQFGEVKEFKLFGSKLPGPTKGCGTVDMVSREAAQSAINNMNDKLILPGGTATLAVKWADLDMHEKKRKAAEELNDPNRDNKEIFFARIPRQAKEEELEKVFSTVGSVTNVVLFKSNPGATTNKGCGIVAMRTHADAKAVLEQLDQQYTFEGMDHPIALKWMDHDLQNKRRRQDGPPGPGLGPNFQGPPGPGFGPGPAWGNQGPPLADEERAPEGCQRDAYKLFLANVPKTWELEDLRKVLSSFGQIIEMNLVRDKQTKQPRGVAFAWYKNRLQADRAIRELHNKPYDQGNGIVKPMAVSKAKSRRASGGQAYSGPGPINPGANAPFTRPPPAYQASGGFGGPRPQAGPASYNQNASYYQATPQAAPYDPFTQQTSSQPSYSAYQAAPAYQAQPTQAASLYQQPAPQQSYTPPAYSQSYSAQPAAYNPPVSQAYAASSAYTPTQQASSYNPGQSAYGQPQAGQYSSLTQTAPMQSSQGAYSYGGQTGAGSQPSYGAGQQTGYTNTAPSTYGATPDSGSQYSYAPSSYTQPSAQGYNYGSTPQ